MKKIFTLTAALLFTAALFAADRRPVVQVNSSKNYKIVIDGRAYFGDDIIINTDCFFGDRHTIKVFEMSRGYFGDQERLLDVSSFCVDRNDVVINIDWFGNISIRERKNYRRYGYDDRDRCYGNDDRYDYNNRNGRNDRYPNNDRNDRFPDRRDDRGNRF